ncbi:MAG: hypothetical protein WC901_02265 [Candidatus Margulisiibacteriota bacterium]
MPTFDSHRVSIPSVSSRRTGSDLTHRGLADRTISGLGRGLRAATLGISMSGRLPGVVATSVLLSLAACNHYATSEIEIKIDRGSAADFVLVGETFSMSASVEDYTGKDTLQYQWSNKSNGSSDWTKIDGATNPAQEFTLTSAGDYEYKLDVSDTNGKLGTKEEIYVTAQADPASSSIKILCVENCDTDFNDIAGGFIGDVLGWQVEFPYNTADYSVAMRAYDSRSGAEIAAEGTNGEAARRFYFSGADSSGDRVSAYVVTAEITEIATGNTFAAVDKAVQIASRRAPNIEVDGNQHPLGSSEPVSLIIAPDVENLDIMPAWACDWTFEAGTLSGQTCNGATIYFNQEATGAILGVRVTDDRGTVVADTADSSSQTALYVSRRSAMVTVDSAAQVYTGEERTFTCSVSPDFTGAEYNWAITKDGVASTQTGQALALSFAETDAYATYTLLCSVADSATGTVMAYDGFNNPYTFTVLSASDEYLCERYSPDSFLYVEAVSEGTSQVAGDNTWHQIRVGILDCRMDAVEADCGVGHYADHTTGLTDCANITVYGDLVYDSAEPGYEWWGQYSAADKELYVEGVPWYTLVGTNRLAIIATNSEGLTSSTNVDLPYLVEPQSSFSNYIQGGDVFDVCFGSSGGGTIAGVLAPGFYIYESLYGTTQYGTDNCMRVTTTDDLIGPMEIYSEAVLYNGVVVSDTDDTMVF